MFNRRSTPGGGGHPDGHAWDRWFGLQTQPLVSPRRGSASQSRPPGLEGGTAGRAALGSPGALVPADSDPAGLGLRVCVCPGPGPRPCCVLGGPGPSREARRAGRPSEAPGVPSSRGCVKSSPVELPERVLVVREIYTSRKLPVLGEDTDASLRSGLGTELWAGPRPPLLWGFPDPTELVSGDGPRQQGSGLCTREESRELAPSLPH